MAGKKVNKEVLRNDRIPLLFDTEFHGENSDRLFFERVALSKGYRYVAGVDEVGRGALAGPVVAAAVILPKNPKKIPLGIRDSKRLSPKQRKTLFRKISKKAVSIGIGIVDNAKIDSTSILKSTLEAMRTAVRGLKPPPDMILVDGNQKFKTDIPQKTIVGGDDLSISIGAASIIAKVIRDAIMDNYHKMHPSYRFDLNKGYGTDLHMNALKSLGHTSIHRTTFRGVT